MSDNPEQTPSQTEVTSSEQLVGFVPVQQTDAAAAADNIGVQLVGTEGEDELYFGSQAIELNGERHVIVSQAQDPETGEILLVLQGENGDHIAIQPEALSSMVQASGEGGIQVAVVSQSDEAGLTIAADASSLTSTPSISGSDLTPVATTSIAILPSIIANIPSQAQTATAPTNVVQAIDTPRVTAQEEQTSSLPTLPPTDVSNTSKESEKLIETPTLAPTVSESEPSTKVESESIPEDTNQEKVSLDTVEKTPETKSEDIPKSSSEETVSQPKVDVENDAKVETIEVPKPTETAIITPEPEKVVSTDTCSEPTKPESDAKQAEIVEDATATSLQPTSDLGFGNTAVIQVQDSGNGTSLETLMANAMLSSDGNYVFMAQTEDGQVTSLPPELNLSDVINAGSAGGQAFFIETPEGLVACTASASNEDGAIQLIPAAAGDIDTSVISSAQTTGNLVENQIIQAISGGQAMAYTFTSNSGCLELTPVTTTQTPATKPTRGRSGRPPKSRTITPVTPSMGQTLLLSTDNTIADGLTVSAKPTTPTVSTRGRGRGGARGGRTPTYNTPVTSNTTFSSTTVSTQQQLKSNSKILLPQSEQLKSGITGVVDTGSPGPSQLAASRRTYSKKSNIVWITPDPSQGTTNSSFSTVATTSALSPSKTSQQTKPTTLSTTSDKSTSQIQSTALSSPTRSISPSKATVSTTPQTNTSITLSKAIVSTPSSSKPITSTTITSKNTIAVTSTTKAITPTTTISKTTVATTTATKSTVQTTPTKAITATAANKNTPVGKAVTNTKSTIKVSDITATKTTVSTTLPKTTTTVTKPIVTTPSVTKSITISKTVSSTIPVTRTTALVTSPTKATASTTSNKTVESTASVTKPIVSTTTVTKSTVSTAISSSVTKPIISTTTASKTVSSTRASSKASAPTTAASKLNASKTIVSTPTTVKEVSSTTKTTVSTSIATKSTANESIATSNSVKNVVSKVPIAENDVTESSRLSPTKLNSSKIETNVSKLSTTSDESANEQIVSKIPQSTQKTDSDNSKKQSSNKSVKETNSSEKSKTTLGVENKPILVTNTSNDIKDKSEDETVGMTAVESASILAHKSSEKQSESEVKKSNDIEVNKSVRKSTRNSKNVSTVDESDKQKLDVSANDTKDSKPKEEEKIDEVATESNLDSQKVTTRRTSRKRDISNTLNDSKTPNTDNTVTPTTPTTAVNTPVQITSGRVTRASRTKKAEETPNTESNDSKAISSNKNIKENAAKTESAAVEEKPQNDFDKILEASKIPSTPEPNKTVLANSTETTSTRSVKKKVQFEIKDNNEEVKSKTEEKTTKTPESKTPISTRRSLRSSISTPAVENKINTIETDKKLDKEVNELLDSSKKTETENTTKSQIEISNKTPQRFSTRKRKEVPKSETIEPEVRPAKTLKKPSNKSEASTPVDKDSTNSVEEIQSDSQSLSSGRVRRERKSKNITRIETKIPNKEPTRHSIETSEPTVRTNRKKSFIKSYINENDSEEKEENVRRKTISSLSDLRSPNECYDYSTNECSFYIRHQSSSMTTITPKQSSGNYLCQKCGFHTSRINNLVLHHKDQCTYVKNAVIQQWQSELQKRVKPSDNSDTPTASKPNLKRRKIDDDDDCEPVSTTSLTKDFDRMDADSDEEQTISKPDTNEKTNQNPTISDIDAMLMGSDDEDLLSIDNIEDPKREFGFAEDDIVWVEAHNMHWPALVSKVHSKERKASIKFIDGPWGRKSVKTSVSSISSFDNAEINKKYLRDGRKSVNGDLLVKAVQKAEEFLRKRCLGSDISAAKFFDQIDSDFSENYADDVDRVPINSTDDSSNNKTKETPTVSNDNLAESTSSPVVANDCDKDDDKLSDSNEAVAQWKEKRRLQNAKLLQCIKEGKVETHLVGVYRETIFSERHQKFKSGSESEKNQLKHVPWFGPIDDEEQQEEIYDYCSQLFKSNFKTDGSFDTVAYIFEVWVPEAIVKAISRVRRIELKDSESIFAKGVILSKSEKDELTKEIQKEAEKQLISHSTSD